MTRSPTQVWEETRVIAHCSSGPTTSSRRQSAALVTATFIERKLDYADVFAYVQQLAAANRDSGHEVYVAGQPILTGWSIATKSKC